jgi:hypothetical protein
MKISKDQNIILFNKNIYRFQETSFGGCSICDFRFLSRCHRIRCTSNARKDNKGGFFKMINHG